MHIDIEREGQRPAEKKPWDRPQWQFLRHWNHWISLSGGSHL